MRIEGTTAVVTGARQGLGLALTKALLARGAELVVASDKLPPLDGAFDPDQRRRVRWLACDVMAD